MSGRQYLCGLYNHKVILHRFFCIGICMRATATRGYFIVQQSLLRRKADFCLKLAHLSIIICSQQIQIRIIIRLIIILIMLQGIAQNNALLSLYQLVLITDPYSDVVLSFIHLKRHSFHLDIPNGIPFRISAFWQITDNTVHGILKINIHGFCYPILPFLRDIHVYCNVLIYITGILICSYQGAAHAQDADKHAKNSPNLQLFHIMFSSYIQSLYDRFHTVTSCSTEFL